MYRDDSREAVVQSISQSQWVLDSTHKYKPSRAWEMDRCSISIVDVDAVSVCFGEES